MRRSIGRSKDGPSWPCLSSNFDLSPLTAADREHNAGTPNIKLEVGIRLTSLGIVINRCCFLLTFLKGETVFEVIPFEIRFRCKEMATISELIVVWDSLSLRFRSLKSRT